MYKYLLLFLLFNFLVYIYIKYCKKWFIDVPNSRSSHVKETPRGSGILVSLLSCLYSIHSLSSPLVVCFPLSVIGFIDDKKSLSSLIRFFSQFLTVLLIIYLSINTYFSLENYINNFAFAFSLFFLILLGTSIINFTNFMDCLDGLINGCMFVIFLTLLNYNIYLVPLVICLFSLIFWNWSPAKIFMGDSGSYFLGAIFFSEIINSSNLEDSFYRFLLFSPVFLDAATCLIRRYKQGFNIFKAHRMHLAQRLFLSGWPHSKISLLYILVTSILCLEYLFLARTLIYFTVLLIILLGIWLDQYKAVPFPRRNL